MFVTENEEESSAASTNGASNENVHEPGPQFTTTLTVAPSTKKPMAYFDFAQTDYECFEALVNFAYTAYLEISSKKVAELYKTAFALQMTPVVKACASYLADNLNLKNCIGIRRQANFNDDVYLLGKVDNFIKENFAKIVDESVEFTQLPCIKTTLLYFEDDQRLTDCAEMDDKSSVGSCDIIQDYKKSGKDVVKAMTNGSMDASFNAPIQHRVTGAVPVRLNASRVPNVRYSSTESLNSLDSTDSDPQDTIETRLIALHQTSTDYWVALCVLYRRLVVLSIQLTDDEDITKSKSSGFEVVNLGGYDRGECLKSVEEYDVVRGEWKQLSPMKNERGRFDSAVLNGMVYAVAGSNGNNDLKTAEVYNPKTDEWAPFPSLKKPRSHN
ncbi:kelch repeat protein, partial [Oesophagostomum dentatum]